MLPKLLIAERNIETSTLDNRCKENLTDVQSKVLKLHVEGILKPSRTLAICYDDYLRITGSDCVTFYIMLCA